MNSIVFDTERSAIEAALEQTNRLADKLELGFLQSDESGNIFDVSDNQDCIERGCRMDGTNLLNCDSTALGEIRVDAGGGGFPTGGLTVVTPRPIQEKFPQYYFCTKLVPDPVDQVQASGAENVQSVVEEYTGGVRRITANHDARYGRVDVQYSTVEYDNAEYGGTFHVNDRRARNIELLNRQSLGLSAINLIMGLRRAAEKSYYSKCNEAFSIGLAGDRLVGMLNNPFVGTIVSSNSLDTTTTEQELVNAFAAMDQQVEQQSDLAWHPTTLLIGPGFRANAASQYFSGVNENVLNRIVRSAKITGDGLTYPNGEKRELEIMTVRELELLDDTFNYLCLYTRNEEALVKRTTRPLTYKSPVYQVGGYEIPYEFEISGAHFNQPLSAIYLAYPKS